MLEFLKIVLILSGVGLNFLLSYLIFARSPHNRTNQLFSLVATIFGLWGFCLFLYEYPLVGTSLFWLRGAYISATVMELAIVVFSFAFPRTIHKALWIPSAIYGGLFFLGTLYALLFSSSWIRYFAYHPMGQTKVVFGPLYERWTLGEWVLIFLSIFNLFRSYQRERGLPKEQLRFLLIGFFVFGILVNVPDVVLPIIFHNARFFGLSSLLGLIFTGTISYIILRHRFLDLQRMLREFMFYVSSILFLGTVYFFIVILITKLFFPHLFDPFYIVVGVFVVLSVKYLTLPLWRSCERFLRGIFIQGLYDRETVLEQLNDLTTQTINLRELVGKTLELVYHTFHPTFVMALSLFERKVVVSQIYASHELKPITFGKSDIEQLEAIEKIVLTDELPYGRLKTLLQKKRIAVAVPLHIEGWKRFMFLGPKETGGAYFSYDVGTLELMTPVVRLIAQHVRQVEQIRQFNTQLEKEVEKATAEVQETNKKLQEADAVKDEFISIASHELKTPTTAIQGFLWLVLQKDKELSAYSRDKLERVSRLTQTITTLVNDMLDVSKIDSRRISLHPETFDISQLVSETKGELDFFAVQKDMEISIAGKGSYLVLADRQRIHQVLSNLVNNAIKYTHAGGKITITVKKVKAMIEVSVSDTGIGIRKKDMSQLFTKFGKIEHDAETSQMPGSGLGLYISKNLVELSGGGIWAKSEYKKGSQFTFTLPVSK